MPPFRKWHTRSEQILTCILAIALIIIFVLLVVILWPRRPQRSDENVCKSPICVQEAAKILETVDANVNPCEDFYNFACGKQNSHGGTSLNFFHKVKEKRKHQLLEMYAEEIQSDDHKMVKVAKRLFKKCMDESEIEGDNLRTIKDVLRSVGGWPVLDGKFWDDKKFDWVNATYKLRELGYPYQIFLEVKIGQNQNKTKLLVDLPKDGDTKGNRYQSMDEFLEVEKISEVALIFGSPFSKNEIGDEMRLAYQFRKALAMTNVTPNPVNFDWLRFLQKIIGPKLHISETDYALLQPAHVFNNYFNLLATTPKRTLANYMMWRVIQKQLPYLTRTLRSLEPIESMGRTRGDFCMKTIEERSLTSPIAIMRDRKYLSQKESDSVLKLMENIKKEFVRKLQEAYWLEGKKEKMEVIKMADDIEIVVGEHKNYLDNKIFDDLDVDMAKPRSESFLALLAQFTRNYETCKFKLLNSSLKLPQMDYLGATHAYYDEGTNSIVIPSTAVDGFFHVDRPTYLNYAKLVAHAFFEFLTTILERNGSPNEITKAINENTIDCLTNQTRPGSRKTEVHSIVSQSLGEQLSYAAYETWEKLKGSEMKLVGLDYTPRQVFWIVSIDCHVNKRPAGNHSEARTIIWKSRANNLNFVNDFECKLGTKMNPVDKCRLLL